MRVAGSVVSRVDQTAVNGEPFILSTLGQVFSAAEPHAFLRLDFGA